VEDNWRAVEILEKTGVSANCCFIMFDPYTTIREIADTLQFVKASGAYRIGMRPYNLLNSLRVVKGTPYYDFLKDTELLIPYGEMLFKTRFLSSDVSVFHEAVTGLDQYISPVDLRYRALFSNRAHLNNWLSRNRGQSIHAIKGMNLDAMTKYTKWYDRLPALVLGLMENALDMVKDGVARESGAAERIRLSLVLELLREYEEFFGPRLPFESFTETASALHQPFLTIDLDGGREVTIPNPLGGMVHVNA